MKLTISAAALSLALTLAAPANATVITAQFNGVITSGVDDNGFFGAAGADLTGDQVTATFTVDSTQGASVFDPPNMSETYGGGFFGTTSPVSADIEIGGNSFLLTGTYQGDAHQFAPPSGQSGVQYSVQDRSDSPGGYLAFVAADGASSTSDKFVANYDYRDPPNAVPSADLGSGSFEMLSYDSASGLLAPSDVLSWQPSSATFTVTASVPEPGAWALMLAGFAGLGAAVRQRRRLLA